MRIAINRAKSVIVVLCLLLAPAFAMVATEYSGNVLMNITVDGSQGGMIIGNVVPGFSGFLAVGALAGAVLLAGKRRQE